MDSTTALNETSPYFGRTLVSETQNYLRIFWIDSNVITTVCSNTYLCQFPICSRLPVGPVMETHGGSLLDVFTG